MQQPRQMYGLGSFVKKVTRKVTRPITKVAKKIVPKEIAGIMRVAAPFLPPGYREAAYLLGTARQTGRISPVDLALAAAPTFFEKTQTGQNLSTSFKGTRAGEFLLGKAPPSLDAAMAGEAGTTGLLGTGGELFQFGEGMGPAAFRDQTKLGSLLLGGKEPGTFSKSKLAGLGIGTLSLVTAAETPREAGIALANQTGNPEDRARGEELFSLIKPELFRVPERFRLPVPAANGGLMRTNYAIGSEDPKPVNPFGPKPTGPVLPEEDKPFRPKPLKPIKMSEDNEENMMMAGMDRKMAAQMLADELAEEEFGMDFYDLDIRTQMKIYQIALDMIDEGGGNAMGGLPNNRMDLALGTKPTPEESGLGGLPIEADMRYTGGFMPYGEKEKADDVPARLSKNEFVFTADAVRAAGGGSVQKGAQKMYNTMKQLEAKPEAKGMMA